MSTIRFSRELLTDALWAESLPLLHEHWKEIAHYPDIPLNPARDVYAAAEASGLLRCFTVRAGDDDELVGYALYFVRPNPHYAGSVQASQDVIYIHPWARGRTGYRFIAWCDEQLAAEGVQAVYHHVKVAHNFGAMLERQGYELVDLIYAKRLDGRSAPATAEPLGTLIPETGTLHCGSKDDRHGIGRSNQSSPSRALVADALAGSGS